MGGSGRQSLTRIATFMADYKLFQVRMRGGLRKQNQGSRGRGKRKADVAESGAAAGPCAAHRVLTSRPPCARGAQIEISKSYSLNDWREDLKRVLKQAGGAGQPTVFLFSDTQLKVRVDFSVCVLCVCMRAPLGAGVRVRVRVRAAGSASRPLAAGRPPKQSPAQAPNTEASSNELRRGQPQPRITLPSADRYQPDERLRDPSKAEHVYSWGRQRRCAHGRSCPLRCAVYGEATEPAPAARPSPAAPPLCAGRVVPGGHQQHPQHGRGAQPVPQGRDCWHHGGRHPTRQARRPAAYARGAHGVLRGRVPRQPAHGAGHEPRGRRLPRAPAQVPLARELHPHRLVLRVALGRAQERGVQVRRRGGIGRGWLGSEGAQQKG